MHCLPYLEEENKMPVNVPVLEDDTPERYVDPWGPIIDVMPIRIPSRQAINMNSIKVEPEGGSGMFGMKLWTILLIAAAICYFMNK